MTEIQSGIYATPTDELTALALEARKRNYIKRGKKGAAPERKATHTTKKRS